MLSKNMYALGIVCECFYIRIYRRNKYVNIVFYCRAVDSLCKRKHFVAVHIAFRSYFKKRRFNFKSCIHDIPFLYEKIIFYFNCLTEAMPRSKTYCT